MRSPIRSLAALLLLIVITAVPALGQQPTAWVNELHYDNEGGDTGEFVEVVVEAGFTDLGNLAVVLYNGSNGTEYDTETVDGFDEGTTTNGFTLYSFEYPTNGIQNGGPDGLALCYDGTLIQFLSYEGTFTASGGCADGVNSIDIGVSEPGNTPVGASIGLEGTGSVYSDFTWTNFDTNSRGNVNAGQTLEGEDSPPTPLPLLLSEIVVTPTGGEFVEIYNPNDVDVDLSNVYLTDATFAPNGTFYYNIVTGSNAGGGGFGDFHARFPDGATIAPDEFQTIAMAGAEDFSAEYGVNPTYELFENAPGKTNDPTVPDMREALPGSINSQGGLTNSGEVVVLYKWDGTSDLVQDLDYAVWGDKNEAVDKTGVSIDGPDADSDPSDYAPDTPIADQDVVSGGGHSGGSAFQRIDFEEGTETETGGNGIDGNDETSENLSETWEVLPVTPGEGPPSEPPAVPTLVINEIDYDQPGADDAEFIEVLNTGDAPVNLSGIDLVLVNGSNGTTYDTIPLEDTDLDPGAYYVICGNAANVANCMQQDISSVQNGSPDAVALVLSGVVEKVFQQQTIIDAVSYEGSVPGYVEGTGTTVGDNNSDPLVSLSRFPDGTDTDNNDADFSVRCISPGAENFEVATDCENTGPPGGAGTATLANVTENSPLSDTDIFERNTAQSVSITVQNDAVGKTSQAVLERVSITLPAAWGTPTVSVGDLSGAGFSGASVSVDGQMIEITDASVTGADTGTLTLSGLTTPNPTAVTDDGTYTFDVLTAGPGQSLAPIGSSPTAFVIIPVANLRDIDADGNTVDDGDVVAIEVVSSVSDGVFSTQDLIAYGQDASAGIGFFVNDQLPTFTEGNTFVVKGPVGQFSGLTQLQPDPSDIIDLGTMGPLNPSTLTIAQILADAENLEAQLLNVNDVQITDGPGDPTFQGNTNYTVSDGTASITFRVDADTDLVGTPLPDGTFNLFAILGQFDPSAPLLDGYQLLPRRIEDLFFGAPGQTTVQFSRANGYTFEGGTATATVTLDNPDPTVPTTADIVVASSELLPSEYSVSQTSVTFPAGTNGAQTIIIRTIIDARPEGIRNLNLRLENVEGGNDAVAGLPRQFSLVVQDRYTGIDGFDDGDGDDDDDEPEVTPIGTARTFADGTDVVVEGTVTRALGDFTRIQDDTGGLTIRQTEGSFHSAVVNGSVRPGARVQVEGTLSSFAGLKQINEDDIQGFEILSQDNPLPDPQIVTLMQVADNGEEFESELLRIENLEVLTEDDVFDARTTYALTDQTVEPGTVDLRTPNPQDTEIDGEPVPSGLFTFVGVLGQFSFDAPDVGYQALPVQADDIRPQGNATNGAPSAVTLDTPSDGTSLSLAGEGLTMLDVQWSPASDPNNDALAYTWQVSTTDDFTDVIYEAATTATQVSLPYASIEALMLHHNLPDAVPVSLFHRVVTSDGTEHTPGTPARLDVERDDLDFTLADARTLPLDLPLVVEGTVTRAQGAFTYLQDTEGGLTIRQTAGTFFEAVQDGSIEAGCQIRLVGRASEFQHLYQINGDDLMSYRVVSCDDAQPEPIAVTLSEISTNGEQYEGRLVQVTGVTIEDGSVLFEAGTTYALQDSDVTLRTPNADDTALDGTPLPSGAFTFIGVVGQFDTDDGDAGYQLMGIAASDVTDAPVATDDGETPSAFALHGNYPNPFNPTTTVRFDLPESATVRLEVYDLAGRQVWTQPAQSFSSGTNHTVRVDATSLASGVYVYRLIAEGTQQTFTASGRMILVK